MSKVKKSSPSVRGFWCIIQKVSKWTRPNDGEGWTQGGVVGTVKASTRKEALEIAAKKAGNFRGTLLAVRTSEGVEKWWDKRILRKDD